jgi:hypothetical protein
MVNRGEFVVGCVADCGVLHHTFPMTKNAPLLRKLFLKAQYFRRALLN